jgi:hypothetical protein
MLLRMHPNLHRDPDELATWGSTHRGQADAAGRGPFGRVCGHCQYWGSGPTEASREQARCARFQNLTGRQGPLVPGAAVACKYFAAAEEARQE